MRFHVQHLDPIFPPQTLSPVRLTKPSGSPPVQTLSLSPEDQRFLSGANHLVLCPPPATGTQPSFSESWPSTDLGSSPANTTPSPNADAVTQAKQAGKSMDPDGRGDQEDSVLAKYRALHENAQWDS